MQDQIMESEKGSAYLGNNALKNPFEHQGGFDGGVAELKATATTAVMLCAMPSVNRCLVQPEGNRTTVY